MRSQGFLLLVWLLALSPAQAVTRIACVGDSITEGSGLSNPAAESYPAKLGRLLGPDYEVRNFGVSGTTLLKQGDYPYWTCSQFKPSHDYASDVVILKLGTNDSKPQNWRYSTNYLADYLELIATYTNGPTHPRIILCTPCPVFGSGAFSIRPGVVATNVAPLVRELAVSLGLQVIDFHTLLGAHREWFPDTVHPNSRGTTTMAALIFAEWNGGLPGMERPRLALERTANVRAVLEWPSAWGGLVLQSATVLRETNTAWTVVEQVVYNDNTLLRVTNTASGAARYYRLWQP